MLMKIRIKHLVVIACLLIPSLAIAHLCNDVFAQAKDNLAVKVDVRDGQLKIGKKASFNVYLLNTMDRPIAEIFLRVNSPQFTASVTPDPNWKRYPKLNAVKRGGKKQFFTVTLKRKSGVADGKYKIGLQLYSKKMRLDFKTIQLADAAAICEIPRAGKITIDGSGKTAEWGEAHIFGGSKGSGSFTAYKKDPSTADTRGKIYLGDMEATYGTSVRMMADDDYVYCLFTMMDADGAKSDKATIYAAGSTDGKAAKITFNRVTKKIESTVGTKGLEYKVHATKPWVECKIPRALLGIKDAKSFHLNFSREAGAKAGKELSCWRGNRYSVDKPIVFAQFKVAD
jgi:hypothetical protein